MRASAPGESHRRSAVPLGKMPVTRPVRVEPETAADDIRNGAEHREVDSLGGEFDRRARCVTPGTTTTPSAAPQ